MGAAASMKNIYQDAIDWGKLYFDKQSYKEDFDELNVNGDGVITYEMLLAWIQKKSADGSFWGTISTSETIMHIAFDIAGHTNPDNTEEMVVGLNSFKEFLIHLFVLSVIWVHFKHADEWSEGENLGSEKLSVQKFKMACRTFSCAQAREKLTDEMLQADFDMLDVDKSGTIEFSEVCRYCANFFKFDFAKQFAIQRTALNARKVHNIVEGEQDPANKSLRYIRTVRTSSTVSDSAEEAEQLLITASAKAHKAMDVIGDKVAENAKVATFEEIKISTEILLGITMD